LIIGSVKDMPTRDDAERAAESHRLRANRENPEVPPPTMEALVQRYLTEVLPTLRGVDDNTTEIPENEAISQQCARTYRSVIKNWIAPRWYLRPDRRRYLVRDFEETQMSTAIEAWLKSLLKTRTNPDGLQPKTVRHIYSVMRLLFKWATKWGYINRNPMADKRVELPRGPTKRCKPPRSLSPLEFDQLRRLFTTPRERLLVELGGWLGTRISEAMGLKWKDVNLNAKVIELRQSVAAGRVSAMKTAASKTDLPIPDHLVPLFEACREVTPYRSENDWVFASPVHCGKRPFWAGSLLKSHIIPTVEAAGLGRIGWHTLRHSYAAWSKGAGLQPGQMQTLMRHENPSMSLQYGTPDLETKRRLSARVIEYAQRVVSEAEAKMIEAKPATDTVQ
jgi:integrase